jgi:hypothetical protein
MVRGSVRRLVWARSLFGYANEGWLARQKCTAGVSHGRFYNSASPLLRTAQYVSLHLLSGASEKVALPEMRQLGHLRRPLQPTPRLAPANALLASPRPHRPVIFRSPSRLATRRFAVPCFSSNHSPAPAKAGDTATRRRYAKGKKWASSDHIRELFFLQHQRAPLLN